MLLSQGLCPCGGNLLMAAAASAMAGLGTEGGTQDDVDTDWYAAGTTPPAPEPVGPPAPAAGMPAVSGKPLGLRGWGSTPAMPLTC